MWDSNSRDPLILSSLTVFTTVVLRIGINWDKAPYYLLGPTA